MTTNTIPTLVDVTTVQCRNCRAVWDTSLNFCGRCGQCLRGSTASVQIEPPPHTPPLVAANKERDASGLRRLIYIVTAILICSVLFSSLFVLVAKQTRSKPISPVVAHAPQGMVWFNDVYAQGDGVVMHLSNLSPPPNGHVYAGWLFNAYRPDQLRALGPLVPDKNGVVFFDSGQLPAFNPTRQNLRLAFTRAMVTIEAATTSIQRPMGPTVLQGMIRAQALDGITQLFANTAYTPGQSALIAGMRSQIREVSRWIANMLDSMQYNSADSVRADLLRLVYVIEGSAGADSMSLNVLAMPNIQNEGDGFGLLSSKPNCQLSQHTCGYFDAIRSVLQSLVASNAISAQDVQQAYISLATAEQLTQTMLQRILHLTGVTTLDLATRSSLILLGTLSDTLLNGYDRDGDGSIDPIPGEASIAQLYTYLQFVGAIKLS